MKLSSNKLNLVFTPAIEFISVSQDVLLPAFTGMPASELRLRLFMQHRILLKKANAEEFKRREFSFQKNLNLIPDEIQ